MGNVVTMIESEGNEDEHCNGHWDCLAFVFNGLGNKKPKSRTHHILRSLLTRLPGFHKREVCNGRERSLLPEGSSGFWCGLGNVDFPGFPKGDLIPPQLCDRSGGDLYTAWYQQSFKGPHSCSEPYHLKSELGSGRIL